MRVFVRHARGESRQGNGKLMMMTRREIKEYQRERSRTTHKTSMLGTESGGGDEGGGQRGDNKYLCQRMRMWRRISVKDVSSR